MTLTLKKAFLFLTVLMVCTPSEARIFSFENESIAPYINLRAGITSMGTEPYRWQSASTYGGDDVDLIYGGEFGIYFRGGGLGVALGVLVHTFDPVTGGKGFDAGGTELFSADIEGVAYAPQIVFDYQLVQNEAYLWKLLLGGGYQFATIENAYTFSAAGQALNGGQASLTESYKQQSLYAIMGASTEFMMSGTTTLTVTAGYHYNFGGDWKYGQGGQNFAGTHSQEGALLFEDGSAKTIDWSYPFVQLGFQFYVDTVR